MPERSIRFGIFDEAGNRAATWKCWTQIGSGNSEVYLACRELFGALKASFHQSGQWHIGYDQMFFEENVVHPLAKGKGRFIAKWPRPQDISPGVTLSFRIVTPWSSVNTPFNLSEYKKVHRVKNAPEGKATEIDIIFTGRSTLVNNWPGKSSMNTNFIGSMELDNGDRVWIVYMVIDMPKLNIGPATPQFFKGRSIDDLEGPGLRAILFGDEPDGSRVLYDCISENLS